MLLTAFVELFGQFFLCAKVNIGAMMVTHFPPPKPIFDAMYNAALEILYLWPDSIWCSRAKKHSAVVHYLLQGHIAKLDTKSKMNVVSIFRQE